MKTSYTLADLEAAINYWRMRSPSQGDEMSLCREAAALAEPYALMIFNSRRVVDADALTTAAKNALSAWDETAGSR